MAIRDASGGGALMRRTSYQRCGGCGMKEDVARPCCAFFILTHQIVALSQRRCSGVVYFCDTCCRGAWREVTYPPIEKGMRVREGL